MEWNRTCELVHSVDLTGLGKTFDGAIWVNILLIRFVDYLIAGCILGLGQFWSFRMA